MMITQMTLTLEEMNLKLSGHLRWLQRGERYNSISISPPINSFFFISCFIYFISFVLFISWHGQDITEGRLDPTGLEVLINQSTTLIGPWPLDTIKSYLKHCWRIRVNIICFLFCSSFVSLFLHLSLGLFWWCTVMVEPKRYRGFLYSIVLWQAQGNKN